MKDDVKNVQNHYSIPYIYNRTHLEEIDAHEMRSRIYKLKYYEGIN